MRIRLGPPQLRAIGRVALLLVLILAGCPGTLADKDRYFVDGQFVSGDLTMSAAGRDRGVPVDGGVPVDATVDLSVVMPDPCGDVPSRLFIPSCGGGGCHGSTAPQNNLDLVSPGVAMRVVGKTAVGCPVTLADPKNPDGSLLYTKLAPSPPLRRTDATWPQPAVKSRHRLYPSLDRGSIAAENSGIVYMTQSHQYSLVRSCRRPIAERSTEQR